MGPCMSYKKIGCLSTCAALQRGYRAHRPKFDRMSHRQVARGGVTDDAIAKIREQIASGAWGPGTKLPREADLAAELGLSRSSLREAVRALALVRVLEVRQG